MSDIVDGGMSDKPVLSDIRTRKADDPDYCNRCGIPHDSDCLRGDQ